MDIFSFSVVLLYRFCLSQKPQNFEAFSAPPHGQLTKKLWVLRVFVCLSYERNFISQKLIVYNDVRYTATMCTSNQG
jgi:hypothetical protein